nr:MAG TPA: hypothetical protein [Caudoviricetes sp.]
MVILKNIFKTERALIIRALLVYPTKIRQKTMVNNGKYGEK